LTLPWVLACRFAPCWAAWLTVLNIAAALYGGSPGFSRWSSSFTLDLAVYVAVEALSARLPPDLSPRWLRRAILAAAMFFATLMMIELTFEARLLARLESALEVLLFLAGSAALAGFAAARKSDTFALAVLALSWVAVTTALLGRLMVNN